MSELISRQQAIDAMLNDKVEITEEIKAIGSTELFKTINMTCDRHAKMLRELPSADSELINELDFGINASTGDSAYMVGLRNGLRLAKSYVDSSDPQFEEYAEPQKVRSKDTIPTAWIREQMCDFTDTGIEALCELLKRWRERADE